MGGAVLSMRQACPPVVELGEELGANQLDELWVCSQQASGLMQQDSTHRYSAYSTPPERPYR